MQGPNRRYLTSVWPCFNPIEFNPWEEGNDDEERDLPGVDDGYDLDVVSLYRDSSERKEE